MFGDERQRTKILLADDQHVVRQGIRQLLEQEADFEVVGDTGNGLEVVKLSHELKPDLILMEARISKQDGVEIISRVKAEHPKIAVLILTSTEEEDYIVGLVAAGANGCLFKNTCREELIQAIRSIRAGGFVCDPALAHRLSKRTAAQPVMVNSAEHLTHRELDVLKLTGKGMSNKDIAIQLGIGSRTVKHHLMNIFDKMNVRSRTEAVAKALRHGWLESGSE